MITPCLTLADLMGAQLTHVLCASWYAVLVWEYSHLLFSSTASLRSEHQKKLCTHSSGFHSFWSTTNGGGARDQGGRQAGKDNDARWIERFQGQGTAAAVERGGPGRFFSLRIPDGGGYSGVSGFGDGEGESKSLGREDFNFKQVAFLVSAGCVQ